MNTPQNDETTTIATYPLERKVRRKIFVCVLCEGVYMDSPVTECDCETGADEFIEGVAEYVMPNVQIKAGGTLPDQET